jgi:hypothetical protein
MASQRSTHAPLERNAGALRSEHIEACFGVAAGPQAAGWAITLPHPDRFGTAGTYGP